MTSPTSTAYTGAWCAKQFSSPIPPARKTPDRDSPKLTEEIKGFIDGILLSDKKIPRKQRHTARRMWERCVEEMGSSAAKTTVREYVSQRKRDLGLGFNVFVPQHHPAGAQGEVDIYEALVYIQKEPIKVQIVDVRSEFSADSLHTAYPRATQNAFFEAMELSLEFIGGAFPIMRFDNLKAAVARILQPKLPWG